MSSKSVLSSSHVKPLCVAKASNQTRFVMSSKKLNMPFSRTIRKASIEHGMSERWRGLWASFGVHETHSLQMFFQSTTIDIFSERICRVLVSFDLGQCEVAASQAVLDPEVRHRKVADLP